MKIESQKTVEYEDRINQAYEAYSKVPAVKGAEYSKDARDFFGVVSTNYFEYLAIAWADKIKTNPELLGDAFFGAFKGEDNLLRIAEKYDGRSSFFSYLHSCVCKRIQGSIEKTQIDIIRGGITKAFSNREERVLKKLLLQQGEAGSLDFWGELQFREFCIMIGQSPDKWNQVQQIYQKNLQVNM